MSEKKLRKGKGKFKLKTLKTNPLQNNQKILQLMAEAYYDRGVAHYNLGE